MGTAAALTIGAFLVHEIYDLDIWWHIAIGRDMLAKGAVPLIDQYSLAGFGRSYHDSHWLFQFAMAGAHTLAGMIGVQLLGVAIWAATLWTCFHACRNWVSTGWAALLVFLVAMSAVERFLPRPEIVTFLMVALFYDRLQSGAFETWRGMLSMALLQIVWTNSHGLFVLGPFLVGCYWIVAAVSWVRHRDAEGPQLTRLLLAVVLATLVTPWGLGGWRYAWLLLREGGVDRPAVFQALGELSPVFGPVFGSSPAFWFFVILLVLVGAALLRGFVRRELALPRTLIVVTLAAVALTGRRNVVLFGLAAAPFIAEVAQGMPFLAGRAARRLQLVAAALILVFAAYPLTGAFYVSMELPARFGLGPTPSFFPHGLPDFLDQIGFEGRVLQSNTLGGFYSYHGFPERLPLTDGRWEVYDTRELEWILSSSRQPGQWRQVVQRYGITGILLAHTSPEAKAILPEISQSSDWLLVYYDAAASFWMARAAAGSVRELRLASEEALPELGRVDDRLIFNAFLAGVDARGLQKRNLEQTLELGWRRAFVLEQLGKVELELRQYDEAETTFRRLLEKDRRNVFALNQLAFLAFRVGDLESARRYIQRAVELDPDNAALRENLERVERSLEPSTVTP